MKFADGTVVMINDTLEFLILARGQLQHHNATSEQTSDTNMILNTKCLELDAGYDLHSMRLDYQEHKPTVHK